MSLLLEYLSTETKVKIECDPATFKQKEIDIEKQQIDLGGRLRGVRLGTLLDLIARQVGEDCVPEISSDKIVLTFKPVKGPRPFPKASPEQLRAEAEVRKMLNMELTASFFTEGELSLSLLLEELCMTLDSTKKAAQRLQFYNDSAELEKAKIHFEKIQIKASTTAKTVKESMEAAFTQAGFTYEIVDSLIIVRPAKAKR